eukprot:gene52933-31283_t
MSYMQLGNSLSGAAAARIGAALKRNEEQLQKEPLSDADVAALTTLTVVGRGGGGKTNLVNALLGRAFVAEWDSTRGVDSSRAT